MAWLTKVSRWLASRPWMARIGPVVVPLDRWFQRRTRGRVTLAGVGQVKSLLLTTTGRRSGQPRSVPLMYLRDGETFVVVGSNWGKAHHPAWSDNLLANPQATIAVAGRELRVRAELAEGNERDRLWRLVTTAWPFDAYAERSGRELRIFVLRPAT